MFETQNNLNTNNRREVLMITLEDIIPNRFQPRLTFDMEALNELSQSIKEHGVIEPLIVRKIQDKYEIIAGERRYKASSLAGLKEVPCIIMELDDNEAALIAVIENVQRKEMTPLEEAKSFKKILDKGFITQDELAKKIGKSQSSIANKLRLLNLDDTVQDAILNEKISERHARSLLKIEDKFEQRNMLKEIIDNRLTVRQLDEIIKEKYEKKGENMNQDNKEISVPVFNLPNNQFGNNQQSNIMKNIQGQVNTEPVNVVPNNQIFKQPEQITPVVNNNSAQLNSEQSTNNIFKQPVQVQSNVSIPMPVVEQVKTPVETNNQNFNVGNPLIDQMLNSDTDNKLVTAVDNLNNTSLNTNANNSLNIFKFDAQKDEVNVKDVLNPQVYKSENGVMLESNDEVNSVLKPSVFSTPKPSVEPVKEVSNMINVSDVPMKNQHNSQINNTQIEPNTAANNLFNNNLSVNVDSIKENTEDIIKKEDTVSVGALMSNDGVEKPLKKFVMDIGNYNQTVDVYQPKIDKVNQEINSLINKLKLEGIYLELEDKTKDGNYEIVLRINK